MGITKIEWCDYTANLWWGCVSVHEGCNNCYAETLSKRWGNDIWGNDRPRKIINSFFPDLEKYQRLAKEAGEVHRVFVGSMMDIFEKPMPLINSKGDILTGVQTSIGFIGPEKHNETLTTGHLRASFFKQIDAGNYPNLLFLLLTKRPSNINKYIPESWKTDPPKNVMFGTSPVNNATCAKLIYQLLQVKGKRFLSVEPQLEEIDFYKVSGMWDNEGHPWRNEPILYGIDWLIQGGESGHHKRPFNIEWAYKMKEQCEAGNVPYFFKQIDKVKPIPEDLMIREFPIF